MRIRVTIVLIVLMILAACSPSAGTEQVSEMTASATPANTPTRTSSATPSSTPTPIWTDADFPTLTPSPEMPLPTPSSMPPGNADNLPFDWPLPPITNAQLADARACNLSPNPYLVDGSGNVIATVTPHPPASACDWAAQAEAYAEDRMMAGDNQLPDPLPEEARDAFRQAFGANPAYAFASNFGGEPLYSTYIAATPLVEPPPFAGEQVTELEIEQLEEAPGYISKYQVSLTRTGQQMAATGTFENGFPENESGVTKGEINSTIDASLADTLGASLGDLLPVDQVFWLGQGPMDGSRNWTVQITYESGTTIEMAVGGGVPQAGGPWFTTIDGQVYMQYSTAFLDALAPITEALGLPTSTEESRRNVSGGYLLWENVFPSR